MGHLFYKVFTVYNTINSSLPSIKTSLNPDSQINRGFFQASRSVLPPTPLNSSLPVPFSCQNTAREGIPCCLPLIGNSTSQSSHLRLTLIEKLLKRIIKWTRWFIVLNNRFAGEKLMKCTAQLTTYLYTHLYA